MNEFYVAFGVLAFGLILIVLTSRRHNPAPHRAPEALPNLIVRKPLRDPVAGRSALLAGLQAETKRDELRRSAAFAGIAAPLSAHALRPSAAHDKALPSQPRLGAAAALRAEPRLGAHRARIFSLDGPPQLLRHPEPLAPSASARAPKTVFRRTAIQAATSDLEGLSAEAGNLAGISPQNVVTKHIDAAKFNTEANWPEVSTPETVGRTHIQTESAHVDLSQPGAVGSERHSAAEVNLAADKFESYVVATDELATDELATDEFASVELVTDDLATDKLAALELRTVQLEADKHECDLVTAVVGEADWGEADIAGAEFAPADVGDTDVGVVDVGAANVARASVFNDDMVEPDSAENDLVAENLARADPGEANLAQDHPSEVNPGETASRPLGAAFTAEPAMGALQGDRPAPDWQKTQPDLSDAPAPAPRFALKFDDQVGAQRELSELSDFVADSQPDLETDARFEAGDQTIDTQFDAQMNVAASPLSVAVAEAEAEARAEEAADALAADAVVSGIAKAPTAADADAVADTGAEADAEGLRVANPSAQEPLMARAAPHSDFKDADFNEETPVFHPATNEPFTWRDYSALPDETAVVEDFDPRHDVLMLPAHPMLAEYVQSGYLLTFEDGQNLLLAGLKDSEPPPLWEVHPGEADRASVTMQ